MQTADRPSHLTERKVFNSGLYIEVLRGCLTCDVACSLVHLEEEKKKKSLLKCTFPTSRWKHLFLQRGSAFGSFWDGVKVGLVSASVREMLLGDVGGNAAQFELLNVRGVCYCASSSHVSGRKQSVLSLSM